MKKHINKIQEFYSYVQFCGNKSKFQKLFGLHDSLEQNEEGIYGFLSAQSLKQPWWHRISQDVNKWFLKSPWNVLEFAVQLMIC